MHRHIPCITCGYDIRGLPPDTVCPECATALKETLESPRFLRGCTPELIQRYRLSVWLLAMCPTLVAGGIPIAIFALFAADALGTSGSNGPVLAFAIACAAACVCLAVGAELITRNVPARPMRPEWARVLLRVGAIVTAITWCFVAACACLRLGRLVMDSSLVSFFLQLSSIAALVGLVRVCESTRQQTQWSLRGPTKFWFNWIVLAGMFLASFAGLVLTVLARPGTARMVLSDWGTLITIGGLFLNAPMLWKLVDAVSLESSISKYARKQAQSA